MNLYRRGLTASVTVGLLAGAAGIGGVFETHPASAQDVDVQEIFRCVDHPEVGPEHCDEARSIILNNCTTCHTFVPIVLMQNDSGAWTGLLERHRDRAVRLSDEEFETIREYLAANFNEDLEPPELPPALLDTWTSY